MTLCALIPGRWPLPLSRWAPGTHCEAQILAVTQTASSSSQGRCLCHPHSTSPTSSRGWGSVITASHLQLQAHPGAYDRSPFKGGLASAQMPKVYLLGGLDCFLASLHSSWGRLSPLSWWWYQGIALPAQGGLLNGRCLLWSSPGLAETWSRLHHSPTSPCPIPCPCFLHRWDSPANPILISRFQRTQLGQSGAGTSECLREGEAGEWMDGWMHAELTPACRPQLSTGPGKVLGISPHVGEDLTAWKTL